MVAEDIRFAWAAYRAGAFPGVQDGLKPDEFWPAVTTAATAGRPGAGVTTLLARVGDRGVMPVGWLIGWPATLHSPRSIEWRVAWAPLRTKEGVLWATPRLRLEAAVCFLLRARGLALALWCCRRSETRLWEHVCRYGVARTVGTVKGLYGPTEDGMMFQSVEVK